MPDETLGEFRYPKIKEGQGQVLNSNFAVVWHASDELTNHLSPLGSRPKPLKSRAATSQE